MTLFLARGCDGLRYREWTFSPDRLDRIRDILDAADSALRDLATENAPPWPPTIEHK